MSTKTPLTKPHGIAVYIVRRATEGPRYLLLRRCGKFWPGIWQSVTGGIDEGETATQAALREVKEETGLTSTALYSADAVEIFYIQVLDRIAFTPVFVAFVEETQVQLSAHEHDAYEWLSFEEARGRLSWAVQQKTLVDIHERCILREIGEQHRCV